MHLRSFLKSSYRTYEEWKQIKEEMKDAEVAESSYRTYEEWKLPEERTQ